MRLELDVDILRCVRNDLQNAGRLRYNLRACAENEPRAYAEATLGRTDAISGEDYDAETVQNHGQRVRRERGTVCTHVFWTMA